MAIGPLYRPFLQLAAEAGVDADRVLTGLKLSQAQLLKPDTRLSTDQGRQFGRELSVAIGDPELGLRAAARVQLLDADLVGYLVRHAATPLEALYEFARYARLLGDSADCRVECDRGQVTASFVAADGRDMLPETADYYIGSMFRLLHDLSGGSARPHAVHMPRPRPTRPASYRRFFECPVTFEAARGTLRYSEACLRGSLSGRDLRLAAILGAQAEQAIRALPRHQSVTERVRVLLRNQIEHGASDAISIARRIGMSERTLRRRLKKAGSGYRAILDEVRRERALALIERGDQTLAMVAQRVGFSDETAFARAFRRWMGVSPGALRQR